MFPGTFVAGTPDKPAVIRPATGEQLTYRQLDERSLRLARYLRAIGMRPGDHLAVVAGNDLRVLEVYWAALRSGLYITAVNWHLTPAEAAYVVDDCEASALVVSADAAAALPADPTELPKVRCRLVFGGAVDGYDDYEAVLAQQPDEPLESQPRGQDMLYSSGTTGRPKGIKPQLPEGQVHETVDPYTAVFAPMYGFDADTVYLCPAPLYHAAPLRFCGTINSVGGSVIVMDRFDAAEALALIERHRVTHSQWVPTMFVRMLKLPSEIRDRYDVSSMRAMVLSGASCPPEVKRAAIAWFGPVVCEFFGTTEGSAAALNSEEWLSKPGSAGYPLPGMRLRILDADGVELPTGEIGNVYFMPPVPFEYHNDPDKTASAMRDGFFSAGDLGYLDADGWLYIVDRRVDLILSGGVNVYPVEVEDVVSEVPGVAGVAVIGVEDPQTGEAVVAYVCADGPAEDVGEAVRAHCARRLARFKWPSRVEVVDRLPTTPTGKVQKGRLRGIERRRALGILE